MRQSADDFLNGSTFHCLLLVWASDLNSAVWKYLNFLQVSCSGTHCKKKGVLTAGDNITHCVLEVHH
jgi:hypothetical protein